MASDRSLPVTERDFRMPQFRDANPEDYERRSDGAIVRKDRWETGIRSLVETVGLSLRQFEIDQVVEAVEARCNLLSAVLPVLDEVAAGKPAAEAAGEVAARIRKCIGDE